MKLLFAGAESKSIRKVIIDAGVKNTLVSYFYIVDRSVDINEYFDRFEYVALDSGGFTFIKNATEKKNTKKIDHYRYLMNYLEFIEKHKGKFLWVANYDVAIEVGDNRVYEWNELFRKFEPYQRICYVAHDYSIPYENLYKYFDLYDMIGVSGNWIGSKDDVGYFSQVYQLAMTKKKLTHGFAMTNFVSFDRFPFWTADSTTYLGGAKFGTTYVWNGAYFETWDYLRKYRRKSLKNWCELWGVDFEGFCNDQIREVTRFNTFAWLENEKAFNRKTKHKQWWSEDSYDEFL